MNQSITCGIIIVLWGIYPILTRLSSNNIGVKPYIIISTISYFLGTLIITTIIQKTIWNEIGEKLFKYQDDLAKRWILPIVNGLFCLAVPSILSSILLSTTKSVTIVVTTTFYGSPILSSILSYYIFHQNISKLQFGGIIVSIIGAILINIENILANNQNDEETLPLVNSTV
jgi:drug/metabolite transporter (DMT)-like permease